MLKDKIYIEELEKKLLETQTKFDILYNNAPDMYVAVSPLDACVKFCNQTLLNKTGYTEEEVVGFPVFKLYAEKCLPDVESAFNEFKTTGSVKDKQLIIRRKDGTIIDVILNVVSVRNEKDEIIYSTSCWRDITQDLKNRQKQIENEHLLLESQRMANIGSWKYDLESKQLSCSSEIYQIFNIDKTIKIISYAELIKKVEPQSKKRVEDAFSLFLINKEKYVIEYTIILENEEKHLYASSEPIFNNSNELILLIGTIQDITFTKNIQKQLEGFNKNLESKIVEKTEDLKQAQEQLIFSEKMASLGSLVGGVAHEINTPIGIGVTGVSHLVETINELDKKYTNNTMTEEAFKNFLSTSLEISHLIHTNLVRAANLVKSFKQVAVDQISEEKRTFLLKEYLKEVLLSINSITKKKEIKINVICDDNLEVTTYPGALSQILTNLVMNSFIHGFRDKKEGEIDINISKNDKKLSIIYKDNGNGISENNLSKIFNPFFTTNREFGGSGLGLSVIYNIITKSLKGKISCESKINKGTEFRISFIP